MLVGIAIILCCQLLGEAISHAFSAPIPGPVLGMVFMIVLLWLKENFLPVGHNPERYSIETTGRAILTNLSILFVPASVGVIQKYTLLTQYGVALAFGITISTILAVVASVYTFMLVARMTGSKEEDE